MRTSTETAGQADGQSRPGEDAVAPEQLMRELAALIVEGYQLTANRDDPQSALMRRGIHIVAGTCGGEAYAAELDAAIDRDMERQDRLCRGEQPGDDWELGSAGAHFTDKDDREVRSITGALAAAREAVEDGRDTLHLNRIQMLLPMAWGIRGWSERIAAQCTL